MLMSDLVNSYIGDTQIDRMYFNDEIMYEKDLLPLVFETNFIQCTNWSIQYDPARAYILGQETQPVITKPAIISGHTMTSWGVNANVAWPDAKLNLLKNKGMIDFYWEPEYSGTPENDVTLFETGTPKIKITHTSSGDLEASFYDDLEVLIKSVSDSYTAVAGVKNRVRVFFTFDQDTDNELTIKINDETLVTDTSFSDIDRGDPNECTITNFMCCDTENEGGRGSRLRIHAEVIPMTLEGTVMTLEGIPMFLGA